MKIFNFLLLVVFALCFGCSDSNNSNSEATDLRYKVLLNYDGDIVFIGDQTNEAIFDSYSTDYYLSILGYYHDKASNILYFIARDDFDTGFKLHHIDLQQLYDTRDYYYTAESSDITFNEGDYLMSGAMMESQNRYHFLVTEDDYNILLKTYENGSLVQTQNLTTTFDMVNFGIGGIEYFQDANRLVIIQDVFNSSSKKTRIIDLNTLNLIGEHTNFNYNYFGGFGNDQNQFLIGRREVNYVVHEYLTDIHGNLIYDITDSYSFLGRASFGYDTIDDAFEYFAEGDARQEVGTINTTTGELLREGIYGEPHSRHSQIFYFTPN
ncbi:hypothetical protein [Winogradskyella psychrotolerans]|uniref:hypothetical protein n=1 Tax=Winogradskyella psychrotolerans TaxID=1344585 RepID=UPI001C072D1C|nr:hypothetical protein [Winogradskyella psychrotolerans]MBU2926768.1 hypothetical protein [Winogradskyella psychrotolerans]